MRILELAIHNVRGITDLELKLDGMNSVISGPNGSGKSAVVDAIDFLLTGRISRLTGKGTGGITLTRHGPHIDHDCREAKVWALVQLEGLDAPVELARCMAHPEVLEHDVSIRDYLDPVLTLAHRGQYVLTRRDILRYVTAEAGTRAQEIQALLNIAAVEDTRKALVRTQNELKREEQSARGGLDTARAAIAATAQERTYSEETVLKVVNQNRVILGGKPIPSLGSGLLKEGVDSPASAARGPAVNTTLLGRYLQNLSHEELSQKNALIAQKDAKLRELVLAIRSDPRLLRDLERLELVRSGLALVDETGKCPLCDTPWPEGKLSEYLEERLASAQKADEYHREILMLADEISASATIAISSLEEIVKAGGTLGLDDELAELRSWRNDLQRLVDSLHMPLQYTSLPFGGADVQAMLSSPDTDLSLQRFSATVEERCPKTTPEQNAWDTLTRLEENLKAMEKAARKWRKAELHSNRARRVLTSFIGARDAILGRLYEDIRDRFVDLYTRLHRSDEGGFSATIEPDGAGLAFEVDFHMRGKHPPHALHSEGHQDSMGLCLYLTLAERLNQGTIDLIVLDDVVMSVDVGHRRHVCRLLREFFPSKQFLITTHDTTWANQLVSEGVATQGQHWTFLNWSIEYGPEKDLDTQVMWTRIEEALRVSDVPSAAAQLRRGSEQFFSMVCDALQVPVIYRLAGQWELGDLMLPAMQHLKKCVKNAQNAARSWGNDEDLRRLSEFDATRSEVVRRTHSEQWMVNPSVHYNNWANFSREDFRPVVSAFQGLYDLFLFGGCRDLLRVVSRGRKKVAVRCKCSEVHWNLESKNSG